MTLTMPPGRGFPLEIERLIDAVGVAGIDLEQCQKQLRLHAVTESILYGLHNQPHRLSYSEGSRPELEAAARSAGAYVHASRRQAAEDAMDWVRQNVAHPLTFKHNVSSNRAATEEQIIASGFGWCNEQSRVFIALCQLNGIPGRLCFLWHANLRCGHTATEVYLNGRWAFFDPTFGVRIELPDGRLADARDLLGNHRGLAHQAYGPALEDYYSRVQPHVEQLPGWRRADRPHVDKGGDLFAYVGITEYTIEGVEPLIPQLSGSSDAEVGGFLGG